jgi:hypothetical protein
VVLLQQTEIVAQILFLVLLQVRLVAVAARVLEAQVLAAVRVVERMEIMVAHQYCQVEQEHLGKDTLEVTAHQMKMKAAAAVALVQLELLA